MGYLCTIYRKGSKDVEQDSIKAGRWCAQAESMHDGRGSLGLCVLNLEKYPLKARPFCEVAAARDLPEGWVALAELQHSDAEHIREHAPLRSGANYVEPRKYFEEYWKLGRASQEAELLAVASAHLCYYDQEGLGGKGTQQPFTTCAKLPKDPWGMFLRANAYRTGKGLFRGESRDFTLYIKWLRDSARVGYQEAERELKNARLPEPIPTQSDAAELFEATIYFYSLGTEGGAAVVVDDVPLGQIAGTRWFAVRVANGPHDICLTHNVPWPISWIKGKKKHQCPHIDVSEQRDYFVRIAGEYSVVNDQEGATYINDRNRTADTDAYSDKVDPAWVFFPSASLDPKVDSSAPFCNSLAPTCK